MEPTFVRKGENMRLELLSTRVSWAWGQGLPGLFLVLCFLIPSLALGKDKIELKYSGSVHDSATVEPVLRQVSPLIPIAITSAEDLLGLVLDSSRIRIQLADIVAKGGGRTLKMRTSGSDTITILVFIEPILRGYLRDTDDILTTLTHEVIHAIVRQHIPARTYGDFPKWFREGVPNYLLGQGEERLFSGLPVKYKNPYELIGGLERHTHFAEPEITGFFFFAQMDERIGGDGLKKFIGDVLDSRSIAGGLSGLSLQELGVSNTDTRKFGDLSEIERNESLELFWRDARQRAQAIISDHIDAVAQPLFECMTLYFQGRSQNQKAMGCYQELISTFPATYAAEVSHYWLAMCYYRISEWENSRSLLAKFVDFNRDYGLLDDVRYYELMIQLRLYGKTPELLHAAEDYLRLFPEAKPAKKVQNLADSLRKKLDANGEGN